jgi:ATP-dependent protease ClpP protease subunit
MKTKRELVMPRNNPTPPVQQNSSVQKAFVNKSINSLHSFYLSGSIEEPSEYVAWFEIMRNANENDVIQIHINSYGGDLFTAIQFMRAIADTQAHVICSVEGACMSAATMIFLCADTFEVSEHSMFMFHNYSSVSHGKGGEMFDNIIHERKWSEHLLNRIYAGFLGKEEISSLLENKDLWMDGEEVLKRLNKRQAMFTRIAKDAEKKAKKPVAEKKPEPKAKPAAKPAAKKTPPAKKAPVKK